MGRVVSIPARDFEWWQMEEGVSLQVQRRKFQSLQGILISIEGLNIYHPLHKDIKKGERISHGLPTLNLNCHAITMGRWCKAASSETEIRSADTCRSWLPLFATSFP